MIASIIIVVFNGQPYLEGCLNSLIQQTGQQVEIILVDNASSDGSDGFISEYYPGVRLVRNRANIGFAAACNQGATLASKEFLVFLNQDTQVCPGWLEGLLAPFSADSSIGLVTSRLLMMSQPEKINMCGQDIHFSGLSFARGFLQPADGFSQAEVVGAVSGASFAIRRQLWQHLGGFDERLFMYYEETDLSWRAWLAGYTSYYAPQSLAYHDGRRRPSSSSIYYSARNRWILLLNHWGAASLLLLSPGLLLAELAEWGAMLLYGREGLSAKLRSAVWLVSHFPALLLARRASRSTRAKPDWFLLEHCTSTLSPTVLTGGVVGKWIVFFLNILFSLNYRAVLLLERLLNI